MQYTGFAPLSILQVLPFTCQDGGSGEDFSKDSIEREERRLTELGRRTIEIFVLAHIFRYLNSCSNLLFPLKIYIYYLYDYFIIGC